MSLFPLFAMLLLAVSDILFSFCLRNNSFLNPKSGESLIRPVVTVFVITAISYIAGVNLTESYAFTISVVFAAGLSSFAFCIEEFLSKRKDGDTSRFGRISSYFNVVWFLTAVILLSLLYDRSFDNSIYGKELYIYMAVCFAIDLITVVAYSSIKTKVSAFRNGKTLAIIALLTASVTFGAVVGTILGACLN